MDMRLDQPGHNRAPLQVDDANSAPRLWSGPTHGNDAIVPNGYHGDPGSRGLSQEFFRSRNSTYSRSHSGTGKKSAA